jgi:hypothetical protein
MQFEALINELALGAEIIRSLAAGFSRAEARIRPAPESWSALEVIAHLYDEEQEDFRQRLDITLHRPTKDWPLIDPQGWVTSRAYNERDFDETLKGFLVERERSLSWLKALNAPDWEAAYETPFGQMKAGDLLASWVAHDNLHTRQLVELRWARLLKMAEPYDVRYAGEW